MYVCVKLGSGYFILDIFTNVALHEFQGLYTCLTCKSDNYSLFVVHGYGDSQTQNTARLG